MNTNLNIQTDPRLIEKVSSHPRPLLFATISGAHFYGFPSPDSDYDLRGAHILPICEVIGLNPGLETIELSNHQTKLADGIEFDIVSHDIKKFFTLLLKKNGYVLEQLYSPLIVHTSPGHAELKSIATGCITRHHAHHYLGFAETQWNLFQKENPRRIKPLLYVYRVLLTGIHLMRTGRIEANLSHLNALYNLPQIPDLIAQKLASTEQSTLAADHFRFHQQEITRLTAQLHAAAQATTLPNFPSAQSALNDLLIRLRTLTTPPRIPPDVHPSFEPH